VIRRLPAVLAEQALASSWKLHRECSFDCESIR
jgi:hypothetical protein